jgi:hypothetical protein
VSMEDKECKEREEKWTKWTGVKIARPFLETDG